jgi:hypothetical protein
MPVGMLQETPGLTVEMYDAVNEKMDIANNPPAGLIVHTCGPMEGGLRIFDVWESAAAFERFAEERVRPAVDEVMQGQQGGGPPSVEVYELHNLVRL